MKRIAALLTMTFVFCVYARDETDTAMSETVAARMKSKGQMHEESTLGIQSSSTGGGVTYSTLGAQSGRLIQYPISAPTSGPERREDRINTTMGGVESELYSPGDIAGETGVGTPSYDAKKLDLGTGGIIPSRSTFAPEYQWERLPR